jgi:hypothetical protein
LASCQVTSARRDALLGLLGVYTGSPNTEERLVAAWSAHNPDSEPSIGARAATSLANWMVISGRPEEGLIWAERAVAGTVPDSALWAMARTAHAYSLGKAGQVAEGLTVLSFLPPSGNDVPRTEIDALIMRGMLKVYVDDLSGAIADLGGAAARLRSGVPATYPVPCLSHLSEAHFRRGDWDAAMTYARLATSLAQDADRPLDLVRAHARSAQVFGGRGQWSAAEERVGAAREATARFPTVLAVATCAVAAVALALHAGTSSASWRPPNRSVPPIASESAVFQASSIGGRARSTHSSEWAGSLMPRLHFTSSRRPSRSRTPHRRFLALPGVGAIWRLQPVTRRVR